MQAEPGYPRPTILVVDDNEDMRAISRLSLEELGFSVVLAEEGREALNLVTAARPDLVLLDVLLPGMDGFTVCSELRSMPGGDRIPILMMTGLDDLESMKRAYEAGATDFVTKPFNWFVLAHRLMYILRSSETFNSLIKSEAKNRALIDAIPDAMIHITSEGALIDYKAPSGGLLPPPNGHSARLEDILSAPLLQRTMEAVETAFATREPSVFEHSATVGGVEHHYEMRVVVCGEKEALMILRDITERKLAEEHIRFMAYHDSLTHLPNTYLFREHMKKSIASARENNRIMSVLFLDLDRFKDINDTLGHHTGDLLLQAVAERIKNGMRRGDIFAQMHPSPDQDLAARMGGDEFTLLLNNIKKPEDVSRIAQRIIEEIAKPFMIDSRELLITASIGIAIFPQDGDDIDLLLKNADAAMYHAKVRGRNNFQFFDQSMNAHIRDRLLIEGLLRKAALSNELTLQYQPIVSIDGFSVTGLESFINWSYPDVPEIPTSQVVSMCEELDLMGHVGTWAVRTACMQASEWRGMGFPVNVTINLSLHQFRQHNLAAAISGILADIGLDPGYLAIEIAESIIMQDVDASVSILSKLKETGCSLSIDDFGIGYSSLSHLRRLPIDMLKLSPVFMGDFNPEGDEASLIRAITAFAQILKLKVCIDGVRKEEDLAFLRSYGCNVFQGELFSPPVNAAAVTSLLQKARNGGKRQDRG